MMVRLLEWIAVVGAIWLMGAGFESIFGVGRTSGLFIGFVCAWAGIFLGDRCDR